MTERAGVRPAFFYAPRVNSLASNAGLGKVDSVNLERLDMNDSATGDFLATADASKPAPAFREALRILSRPREVRPIGPNPLGLSEETLASIAAWNAKVRAEAGQ